MSAAAKVYIGRIYRSVTAFTNRLTREKPGRIWDCAMDNRWRSSRSILEIRIDSSLRWPVIHTVPMKSAGFSAPSMAVKRSTRFSTATKTPGVVTSRSIRPIRTSSMRAFGNHEKALGKIAPGTALMAASSNQPTAAKPGTKCGRVFPRKLSKPTSQSRRVRRRHCSPLSRRWSHQIFFDRKTGANPGLRPRMICGHRPVSVVASSRSSGSIQRIPPLFIQPALFVGSR